MEDRLTEAIRATLEANLATRNAFTRESYKRLEAKLQEEIQKLAAVIRLEINQTSRAMAAEAMKLVGEAARETSRD